jgi:hypothetical protein
MSWRAPVDGEHSCEESEELHHGALNEELEIYVMSCACAVGSLLPSEYSGYE